MGCHCLLDEHKTRKKKFKKLIRLHDRELGSITGPAGLQIGASLVAQLVKNPPVNAGDSGLETKRLGFNTWIEKTLWRRKWQPTPVFLPGKFHGQGSLEGSNPWESDMTEH